MIKLLKKGDGKHSNPRPIQNQIEKEIAMTISAIEMAYSNFENAVDPDLIDCYIYQLNSEQKRYRYLLKQAKKDKIQ
ncbi:MAG: YaaL family protein [Lachnospiraceae bacterium]